MATSMRAKMKITSVTRHSDTFETLTFAAIGRSTSYPEDGSDEDNTYAKFSPSAELKISIANPALIGKFNPGETFYVDFTSADAHIKALESPLLDGGSDAN